MDTDELDAKIGHSIMPESPDMNKNVTLVSDPLCCKGSPDSDDAMNNDLTASLTSTTEAFGEFTNTQVVTLATNEELSMQNSLPMITAVSQCPSAECSPSTISFSSGFNMNLSADGPYSAEMPPAVLQAMDAKPTTDPKNPFPCQLCEKKFKSKQTLIRHVRLSHIGEKPFECHICKRKFGYKHILMEHQNLHFGNRPYECKHCNRTFAARSNLIQHQNHHKKPFSCHLCHKRFGNKEELSKHVSAHPQVLMRCSFCNYMTQDQHDMSQHLMTHPNATVSDSECNESDDLMDVNQNKQQLMRCNMCCFAAKNLHDLNKHLLDNHAEMAQETHKALRSQSSSGEDFDDVLESSPLPSTVKLSQQLQHAVSGTTTGQPLGKRAKRLASHQNGPLTENTPLNSSPATPSNQTVETPNMESLAGQHLMSIEDTVVTAGTTLAQGQQQQQRITTAEPSSTPLNLQNPVSSVVSNPTTLQITPNGTILQEGGLMLPAGLPLPSAGFSVSGCAPVATTFAPTRPYISPTLPFPTAVTMMPNQVPPNRLPHIDALFSSPQKGSTGAIVAGVPGNVVRPGESTPLVQLLNRPPVSGMHPVAGQITALSPQRIRAFSTASGVVISDQQQQLLLQQQLNQTGGILPTTALLPSSQALATQQQPAPAVVRPGSNPNKSTPAQSGATKPALGEKTTRRAGEKRKSNTKSKDLNAQAGIMPNRTTISSVAINGASMDASRILVQTAPTAAIMYQNRDSVLDALVSSGQMHRCIHCGILFVDRAIYFLHASLHSADNPWTCTVCHRTYSDRYNFTTHLVNNHTA